MNFYYVEIEIFREFNFTSFNHSLGNYAKSYIFYMELTIRIYGHTNHQQLLEEKFYVACSMLYVLHCRGSDKTLKITEVGEICSICLPVAWACVESHLQAMAHLSAAL